MGILFLISTLQICSDPLSWSVAWLTPLLKQTLSTVTEDTEDTATWVTLDMAALSHMPTPLDPTSLTLSSMCPMVTLFPASTVLLMLVLFTLLRGPLTLTLPTDTEDTEDTATWVTLDTVALSHMLTPLDPTSLMLSSMCPMVTLLPASTVLLTLVLSTLLRGPLTLSTDTEDTDTSDLLPLDSPLCPMPASPFRDMLRDTDTDCGRCQDMGIHYIINSTDEKKKS